MIQRRPPTFCLDCNKPISATAVRCQKCAMPHRARMSPVQVSEVIAMPIPPRHGLSREQIRWIRGTHSDLHVTAIAQRLNVDPAVILAIRVGSTVPVQRNGADRLRAD